jgi:dihydroorotate dehydrogenase
MFSKLRPLLFKVDPEKAHTLAIKSLKFNLIPNVFDEHKNDSIFQTKIFGKDLDNPIGMAAGFDKNAEVYNALFKLGFGFVEVGTITPLKQYGNPKPRVFRLVEDEALINRLGFNNHGAEIVKDRIKRNKKLGLLGINIGPNKDSSDRLNDYLIGLKTFYDDADYITINISSPNTENLRTFHEGNKLQDLLKSIMEEKKNLNSNIPIAVKVSPDISEDQVSQISEILLEHEIKAIIVSNTSEATRDKLSNIQRHQKGGLSGKPIEEKSNILINRFYKLLKGKIKIIGVGGVDSVKQLIISSSWSRFYSTLYRNGFQRPKYCWNY